MEQFEVLGVDWITLDITWVWALTVMLQGKELQPQGEGSHSAFHEWWQTGEADMQVVLLFFFLPYQPPKLTSTGGYCSRFLPTLGM